MKARLLEHPCKHTIVFKGRVLRSNLVFNRRIYIHVEECTYMEGRSTAMSQTAGFLPYHNFGLREFNSINLH